VKFDGEKIDSSNKPLTVGPGDCPMVADGRYASMVGQRWDYALALQAGSREFDPCEQRDGNGTGRAGAGSRLHHIPWPPGRKEALLYVDGQMAPETKAPG